MFRSTAGRFATATSTDLYRRVNQRNTASRGLLETLGARPAIIVKQREADAPGRPSTAYSGQRRPAGPPGHGPRQPSLKSLSEHASKGKARAGFPLRNCSARSVELLRPVRHCVAAAFKLHQCGLPKQMALELFKAVRDERAGRPLTPTAQNIKSAKEDGGGRGQSGRSGTCAKEVHRAPRLPENRRADAAPPRHPGGSEPKLVEGKAIQDQPVVLQTRFKRGPYGPATQMGGSPAAVRRGAGRGPDHMLSHQQKSSNGAVGRGQAGSPIGRHPGT